VRLPERIDDALCFAQAEHVRGYTKMIIDGMTRRVLRRHTRRVWTKGCVSVSHVLGQRGDWTVDPWARWTNFLNPTHFINFALPRGRVQHLVDLWHEVSSGQARHRKLACDRHSPVVNSGDRVGYGYLGQTRRSMPGNEWPRILNGTLCLSPTVADEAKPQTRDANIKDQ